MTQPKPGGEGTTTTVLRGAALRDQLDRLAPLWLELFDHHRGVHPGPYRERDDSWPHRRRHYAGLLDDSDAFAVLAERDGVLVGYAMVCLHEGPDDTWPTGERYAEVETLVVALDSRGVGLGGRLLDVVDTELADLGVGVVAIGVVTGNEAARALYERRGFRPMVTKMMRFPVLP